MARPNKTAVKPAAAPAPDADVEVRKVRPPRPRPEELQHMIQTAAYFRAQKDGFRMDSKLYWKEAEAEILSRFP
jgi:hypothetical protein